MGSKCKVQIFTKEVKKVKGTPSLVLVDQKVTSEEAADKKLLLLQKSKEKYIEVRNEITGIKTVWTRPLTALNYTKKDSKL